MKTQIILAFFCLALAAGCGNKNAPNKPSKAESGLSEKDAQSTNSVNRAEGVTHSAARTAITNDSADGPPMTPLELSLARWRDGDKAAAIQCFLAIDWKRNEGPFGHDSPLSLREKDLPTMSVAERERNMGQVMLQLKDLKQLAAAVREKGTAAAATDPELARRCFATVDECGVALDQSDALRIVQMMGRAIRKPRAAEPANRGR